MVVAQDGVEILDIPASAAARPAVVPLEIKMLLVYGFDVLRRRQADPGWRAVPVVMLASSQEPSDVTACYGLGATLVGWLGFDMAILVQVRG